MVDPYFSRSFFDSEHKFHHNHHFSEFYIAILSELVDGVVFLATVPWSKSPAFFAVDCVYWILMSSSVPWLCTWWGSKRREIMVETANTSLLFWKINETHIVPLTPVLQALVGLISCTDLVWVFHILGCRTVSRDLVLWVCYSNSQFWPSPFQVWGARHRLPFQSTHQLSEFSTVVNNILTLQMRSRLFICLLVEQDLEPMTSH